jgi:hypothetical protein
MNHTKRPTKAPEPFRFGSAFPQFQSQWGMSNNFHWLILQAAMLSVAPRSVDFEKNPDLLFYELKQNLLHQTSY